MDVFHLRERLIGDYRAYSESFIKVSDQRIHEYIEQELTSGALWPDPLIQLNPRFEPGKPVKQLVEEGALHPLCADIFRFGKDDENPTGPLKQPPLHRHQSEAVEAAQTGDSYVLITGTGSGKSLAYIIPIVDYVLKHKQQKGIKAIIVYPMNALANSQIGELEKFLDYGFTKRPVTFARYTGQESDEERREIWANPPDILLTNYVMLEYIMTRPSERRHLINEGAYGSLQFLVLDELHTYRGRQGADVAMLVRRVRNAVDNPHLQVVGTSATLASEGTFEEQQKIVAEVATKIFGVHVKPERIIGESLTRLTPQHDFSEPSAHNALRLRLQPGSQPPAGRDSFIADPLSSWIETTFGLEPEPGTLGMRRATPRSVEEAAQELSRATGAPEQRCAQAIRETLLAGYGFEDGPVFAFRLHQFLSRGDTVYASLDEPEKRHISLSGQKFVPGDRSRRMLPLAFCRECGQEYYVVRRNETGVPIVYEERELDDQPGGDAGDGYGFLYRNPEKPWRDDDMGFVLENVPDDWVEESAAGRRLTPTGRKKLPRPVAVNTKGELDAGGLTYQYINQPFSFCLNCGVSYHWRLRSDYTKLSSLSAGGRSTATTILSLSALQTMRQEKYLDDKAKKLLTFTDNRQDASLQAGHFNDFVEVGLLRAALYRALSAAGEKGLEHDRLPQAVFAALGLSFASYTGKDEKEVKYARHKFNEAFQEVLGYRVFQDLRRGWRLTAPNLEQVGLLKIEYPYLDLLCSDEEEWEQAHPALASASPASRLEIARTLLDYLRRELAVKVGFLEPGHQKRIQYQSSQHLIEPWAIDENEQMTEAVIAYPSTRSALEGFWRDTQLYISEYGSFGTYLHRPNTFPNYHEKPKMDEVREMIGQLFQILGRVPLVEVVDERENIHGEVVPGYQVPAAAFVWKVGDGAVPFHDLIRVPRAPEGGSESNAFFLDFYRNVAGKLGEIHAAEHTAQVPQEVREAREEAFREGTLPVLYCSPTMELGVDIAQLNVVGLRNVPPSAANYAQRSGRAGRHGQPALVFTYCTTGSPHDTYFFRRPWHMVSGEVTTPRLDLANQELIRSHIHSVWLAETGKWLGDTLQEVLDLGQEGLPIRDSVWEQLSDPHARQRALQRSQQILASIAGEVADAPWYDDGWLVKQLDDAAAAFDEACNRWRGLYLSATEQIESQHRVSLDPSRSDRDKRRARALREEAEKQRDLLTDRSSAMRGDFYPYRYFASEGFLPGYNFPRLPLSAYIDGRRGRRRGGDEEYLNRPRFLAISEFGPYSIIYHEGSRYVIEKVILPVGEVSGEDVVLTSSAKRCVHCGYYHPVDGSHNPDLCDRCGTPLDVPGARLGDLFRMQNVSTRRRERISSDEEERLRQGFDIVTGVRFDEFGSNRRAATVEDVEGNPLWRLTYGDAATLWRINLGWRRRQNKQEYGFFLDFETGRWQRNTNDPDAGDEEDVDAARARRVTPYVQDARNCLLLEPAEPLPVEVMASLQSVLKKAIQVRFQLEDSEMAVEPLPSVDERNLILIYEASEGGAGVLRQLFENQPGKTLADVACEALTICHFDGEGNDLKRAPGMREDCEAACYDCLLSYYNQIDHRLLDRKLILPHLLALAGSTVKASPGKLSYQAHLNWLRALCDSELERQWLDKLAERNLRLPDDAQKLIAEAGVRPDFYYDVNGSRVAVFIDGPQHDSEDQKAEDAENDEKLQWIAGVESLRFHYLADWDEIFADRPDVFGSG